MSIIHRMTVRARYDRSNRLGQCLARLHEAGRDIPGCERLRVFSLRNDPLTWQVEGQWRSTAARDAFLGSEGLRADSTPSGHPGRSHLARHSTLIWPPVPRPSGRAVGAQRRMGCIVSLRCPVSSISSPAFSSIRP